MSLKQCKNCGADKDSSDFYPGRNYCKACCWEKGKEWRKNNPDKVRAMQKRHDAKRQPKRHNPEHVRAWSMKSKYGISPEDYSRMFADQNGKCAVCGVEGSDKPGDKKKPRLAIDHCHTTGKVRGLLCGPCNRAEGLLKSIATAKSLVAYMELHAK